MAKPRGENLHDKFFRETFAEPAMMTEFLRHYLPPEFAALLDWQRLEVSKDTFVDEELSEHFSDLLSLTTERLNGLRAWQNCWRKTKPTGNS